MRYEAYANADYSQPRLDAPTLTDMEAIGLGLLGNNLYLPRARVPKALASTLALGEH